TICVLLLALLSVWVLGAQSPAGPKNNGLPAWAYKVPEKDQPAMPEQAGMVRMPGSAKEYPANSVEDGSNPPDWFPEEHGPAPKIVQGGMGKGVAACGSCHLMSGQDHRESADLAGLPADYIARQMAYFKSGSRIDPARMNIIAKATSEADARQAAEY